MAFQRNIQGNMMDISTLLNLVSRWLHIIPVIILVGGTLFLRLAVLPTFADGEHAEIRDSMRRRWAKWIGISTLLLLVTGFYNAYVKVTSYELPGLYVGLMMVKILLAFAVIYFAAVLSGKSAKAVKFREREMHWTNILCGLMLATVLIAGAMKISSTGATPKIKAPVQAPADDTTNR